MCAYYTLQQEPFFIIRLSFTLILYQIQDWKVLNWRIPLPLLLLPPFLLICRFFSTLFELEVPQSHLHEEFLVSNGLGPFQVNGG